jgi:outer membrane protein assembly factor BamA
MNTKGLYCHSMKKIIVCFVFLCISGIIYGEEVTLLEIHIIGETTTADTVILDYAQELVIGKTYKRSDLENILKRVKTRLELTQYFYFAQIYLVNIRGTENAVKAIIEVEDGFTIGFSGGYIFGGIIFKNISGKGKNVSIDAGYNKHYVVFEDYHTGLADFIYSIKGGNRPYFYKQLNGNDRVIQNLGGELFLGYRLPCDIKTGLIVSGGYYFTDTYSPLDWDCTITLLWDHDRRNAVFSSTGGYYYFIKAHRFFPFSLYRTEIDGRLYVSPLKEIFTVCLRGLLNAQTDTLPADYYLLSAFSLNGIRKPFDVSMIGNVIAQTNIELRFHLPEIRLYVFTIYTDIALFADTGFIGHDIRFSDSIFHNAFGAGIRIYCGEPVCLPLRFDVGTDDFRQFAFFWGVEIPF